MLRVDKEATERAGFKDPDVFYRDCAVCKKGVTYRTALCCSRECSIRLRFPRRTRKCRGCGKEFLVRRGNCLSQSCNRTCSGIARRKRSMKTCAQCGVEFEYHRNGITPKFCSSRCYWASRPPKRITVKCSFCGREFTKLLCFAKRQKRFFCSKLCQFKGNRGEGSALWRGDSRRHRGIDWPEKSAECRKRDGYKCQVCGKRQAKRQKLDVDHIIPFRLVGRNDLINLLAVCKAPCHTRKTQGPERAFLRGDVLRFRQQMNQLGWPMDRVEEAIKYWGSL